MATAGKAQQPKNEQQFVHWSDGSVTVLQRARQSDGALSEYVTDHTYSKAEAEQLSNALQQGQAISEVVGLKQQPE